MSDEKTPTEEKVGLPPLREEIAFHVGPEMANGSPSWTLQDPANNRFYRIGWYEFEVLSRWHLNDAGKIITSVNAETTLDITNEDIDKLIEFLASNHLLQVQGDKALEFFSNRWEQQKQHWLKWGFKNYLFLRIPLLKPDAFLEKTSPYIEFVFSRLFWMLVATVACGSLLVISRQWDQFISSFVYFFSWQGFVGYAAALVLSKCAHEFAHAYTARRYGCRIPSMGVALLVMWPVLYTDTSESWKLASRRQLLAIGAAGMLAEIAIASFASLLWCLLPDGVLRSVMFLLATTTWLMTLLVNLNPFMRFDGYFILSDLVKVENLQQRSFDLARWWLREKLWRLSDQVPEVMNWSKRSFLIVYAFLVWVYRLFLFFGIALLVYYFFAKLLGVILFVVEIVWFIVLPVFAEVKYWYSRKQDIYLNKYTVRTMVMAAFLLLYVCVPWQGSVDVPAVLKAEQSTTVYTPSAAKLKKIYVKNGQSVKKGELLVLLSSPELEYELRDTRMRGLFLQWQLSSQAFDQELLQRNQVIEQELASTLNEFNNYKAELSDLRIVAPFDGVVVDKSNQFKEGDWLSAKEPLFILISSEYQKVEAFVGENDLLRIKQQAKGYFYPKDISQKRLAVVVHKIDQVSTNELTELSLASLFDGAIAVREGNDGALIPDNAVYRLLLQPPEGKEQSLNVERNMPGVVKVQVSAESIISAVWRKFMTLFIRESGF